MPGIVGLENRGPEEFTLRTASGGENNPQVKKKKSLFPALCSQFPDVLSLGSEAAAKLISPKAACAFRALSRIEASESAVGATRSSLLRDRPLRHLQHVVANISEDAAHDLVTEAITESDDPAHPRHMAVHLSHCGDPFFFYFWVVFTTTRSPQSKLFRSTVFESSLQHQADYHR